MTTEVSLETISSKIAAGTGSISASKKGNASKQVDPSVLVRYRLMVFLRFVLAIFGGYYLAAITATVMGMAFVAEPLKVNAVLSATMLAFIIYCAVFIGVFMVRSTLKAWMGVILPSLVMSALYWLMKG
jgi:hypothetical protein